MAVQQGVLLIYDEYIHHIVWGCMYTAMAGSMAEEKKTKSSANDRTRKNLCPFCSALPCPALLGTSSDLAALTRNGNKLRWPRLLMS